MLWVISVVVTTWKTYFEMQAMKRSQVRGVREWGQKHRFHTSIPTHYCRALSQHHPSECTDLILAPYRTCKSLTCVCVISGPLESPCRGVMLAARGFGIGGPGKLSLKCRNVELHYNPLSFTQGHETAVSSGSCGNHELQESLSTIEYELKCIF